ncbi:hypothetical protein SDC9_57788 [bioreactor metagenome]|uniref:Uncharacterized protein n=1 Tax=bioreactor metagenome TaxID=1076179 RepID=A0A644XBA6_9ZZZZ
MDLTALEKVCLGAKLVCDTCGRWRWLDPSSTGRYIAKGWPQCCGQTMRLVTKSEQEAETNERVDS